MNSVKIESLNKDNYDTWCIQAEAILYKDGVLKYAKGTIPRPVATPGDDASAKAAEAWDEMDQKAKSDLALIISPSELKQIKGCLTAFEIWEKLKKTYQSQGPAKKAALLKTLILNKMKEGDDVRDHLSTFFDAADKLADMGLTINDEILTIHLLYSLPDSFCTFRTAIETRDVLPTPEILKVKILEEVEARKARNTETNPEAFVARKPGNLPSQKPAKPNPSASGNKKTESKVIRCFKCKKKGHKANQCWSKGNSNSSENPQTGTTPKLSFLSTHDDNEHDQINKALTADIGRESWCLDSGASSHMCLSHSNFQAIDETPNRKLHLANQLTSPIEGIGTVRIEVAEGCGVSLNQTLFVPELRTNLVSVGKIADNGYSVLFEKEKAVILDQSGSIILNAKRINGLYYINNLRDDAKLVTPAPKSSLQNWHEKFGHVHEAALRRLVETDGAIGLKFNRNDHIGKCETCILGKMTQTTFPKSLSPRTTQPLEIIHTDICGPMRTRSMGGALYFVVFIDDNTRWCEVRFLKEKRDLFEVFKEYKVMVEKQTGLSIRHLQSDNGGEYCSNEMASYMKTHGIVHRVTVAHTPQQNGIAERKIRTLVETTRCMMLQAKCPTNYWAEAINTANHVRNRCPSSSLQGSTPFQLWVGRKPVVNYFRTFGIKAFMLDKTPGKSKLQARAKPCTFVGYAERSKAYRVVIDGERKVTLSRDIKCLNKFEETGTFEDFVSDPDIPLENRNSESSLTKSVEITIDTENDIEVQQGDEIEQRENQMKRGPGRPKNVKTNKRGRPKKEYKMVPLTATVAEPDIEDTEVEIEFANFAEVSMQDALNGSEIQEWKNAIHSELKAMVENHSWDIVDKPDDRQIIGCRMVLCNKYKSDGTVERRKARLVAKGYHQQDGIDFRETFAPVARLSSIRMIIALAANLNLTLHQLDVETAFLNGDIEEEMYMQVPEMLEESLEQIISTENQNDVESRKIKQTAELWLKTLHKPGPKVCRIRKAIYGLRQSGRQWYKKLDQKLQSMGLKPMDSDPCIYVRNSNGIITLVAIYVDDIIIASNCLTDLNNLKTCLSNDFKLRDLGSLHFCLGLEFSQNVEQKTIEIFQRKYTQDLLKRFGMLNSKPVLTPMDPSIKLHKPSEDEELSSNEKDKIPYRQLIGSLLYLSAGSRPDIAFAVSCLSQYNNCYDFEHWKAAKRVLRYLRGTEDFGLTYRQTGHKLTGFVDADWGSNIDDRRSFTGYVFMLGQNAISWEARKQRTVALSSTEAEYMGLTEASKEAIHLQSLIGEIYPKGEAVTIFNDNQSAQLLAKNPVFHSRTKHIDIRHHFVRDAQERGLVKIEFLRTEDMPADVLTKGLSTVKHQNCIQNIGLGPIGV